MRFSSSGRAIAACLALGLLLPGPAAAQSNQAIDYLSRSSDEDAADYLAFMIRSWGCVVRREEREAFNAAILDFISLDFGVTLSEIGPDGAVLIPEALNRSLFAFSFRAGPVLVERGELHIARDGTAYLTTCNTLTS